MHAPARTTIICAILVLLAAGLTWTAGRSTAAAAADPEAPELAALIAAGDSGGCRECHEQVHRQWEGSHHARSLMGLDGWIFMQAYLKKGPLAVSQSGRPGQPGQATKANFPCAKCHLPQLLNAPDQAAAQLAAAVLADDKATVGRLNIGCLVCHNLKAVVRGRPEPGVIYGSRDIPDHPGRPVKKSALLKDPLFCGQCHGLGPNLEFEHPVQCATLYGSYLHAYLPAGGSRTCQDCHWQNGDHSAPPDFNRREETAARLRASLPLAVEALAYSFQPKDGDHRRLLVVRTRITSQAGHRIPDG